MSSKVGKRPLRSLSAHEKMEAIRRVHDGESKASVARDIGVPESTLRGWCKNEDKILYLSRQSTPDTDDSDHHPPREKKPRYEEIASLQPFNLSVRGVSKSPPPISEPAVQEPQELAPIDSALNLTKHEAPKITNIITSTTNVPVSNVAVSSSIPNVTISNQDRERERNRAELARLSRQYGLNQSESIYANSNMNNVTNVAQNLSDLSTLTANLGQVAMWNNALLQQVSTNTVPKKRSLNNIESIPQVINVPTTSAAPVTMHNINNNIVNNKNNQKVNKKPQLDNTFDDSVWYWLKTQQAMLGMVQNQVQSNTVDPNSSWFWKWYKQVAYGQQNIPQPTATNQQIPVPEKPILYQQLTKDSEFQKIDETPKSTKTNTKIRAVLDNLLLNNNNNDESISNDDVTKEKEESTPTSAAEALIHGEMFLKWLEKCGDPSVTAVQILQMKYLLNNVRAGADRKNGSENMKTKVRSRK